MLCSVSWQWPSWCGGARRLVAFQTHGATYNCEEAEERHYIPIYQTKTTISGSDGNIWLYYHSSKSLCNDNGYDAIIYGRYPSATTSIWFGTLVGSPCYIHKSCLYNRCSLLYNSSPCYIIAAPCYIIGAPCYIRGAAAHCMMVRDAIFPSPSTWDKSAFFPPLNNEHESISLDR